MTAQEILDKLLELEDLENSEMSVDSFAYGDVDNPLPNGIGEWEEVEQVGGEDEGSTWYSVKYFKDHNVYIQTNGWYASYHGTDFDEGYGEEVFPVEVKVIQYQTTKPESSEL